MITNDFNAIIDQQIERSTSVLVQKAAEYATDDRLHNFKVAAALQGVSAREALRGMMAKHTVSVFDMCQGENTYSLAMWNEKITDHINYLLLLRAVVEEEERQKSKGATVEMVANAINDFGSNVDETVKRLDRSATYGIQ